jgi:L-alanine-DL-glutamate epimerase-like enolase superfamily enzyme
MMPEDGMRRDTDVVNGIREAVGPDVKLMVDGNFGYDGRLDLLEQFVRNTSDSNVFWLEEMVTHNVEDYKRVRDMQKKYAPQALVVCGEVDRTPISQTFQHLIEDGLIDGYQPDIVSAGYLTWLDIQSQLEGTGVGCIPHDFGNGTFGLYAGAVWGAASPSFVSLEDERCPKNVFDPKWEFKNGEHIVPDEAGLGISIDPEAWKAHEKHEWAVEA